MLLKAYKLEEKPAEFERMVLAAKRSKAIQEPLEPLFALAQLTARAETPMEMVVAPGSIERSGESEDGVMKDLESYFIALIHQEFDKRFAAADKKSVHDWRCARGLKQNALARMSNLTAAALSNIETGKVHPRKGTIARLAKALNVQVEKIAV